MASHNETLRMFLGLKLKQLRLEKGFSLKNLAEKSGLSTSYLNEIEKCKKYPKMDKLMELAAALEVSIEDLVSQKLHKNLGPLEKYVESEFFKELPLEVFGISHQDLYDLMGQSPDKFATFIVTLLEMARSYDLNFEELLFAALRSYQEMHKNYFPDLEQAVSETKRKYRLGKEKGPSFDQLAAILERDFSFRIDQKGLHLNPDLEDVRAVTRMIQKPAEKGRESSHQLYLNQRLDPDQKTFWVAKELGYNILGHKKRFFTSDPGPVSSFELILNDFRSSYFAGALLVDERILVREMRSFFKEKSFSSRQFLSLIDDFEVSAEVFFHRLTQVLPEFFDLHQLFLFRFNKNIHEDRYFMTRELHLSQLHVPHGIGLSEHYCRRWITVSLLNDLIPHLQHLRPDSPGPVGHTDDQFPRLMGAQRSRFFGSDKEYFCLSFGRPSSLNPQLLSCTTLGLLMDEHFKRTVKFWDDPLVVRKEVSQTCERCGITDCNERAAPPSFYQAREKEKRRQQGLQQLLKGTDNPRRGDNP